MRSVIFGRHLVASMVMLLVVTLVLGFGYPLVVTGLSQLSSTSRRTARSSTGAAS